MTSIYVIQDGEYYVLCACFDEKKAIELVNELNFKFQTKTDNIYKPGYNLDSRPYTYREIPFHYSVDIQIKTTYQGQIFEKTQP
jgi:hypothetical protein